jgi:nucleotidyltransferase/DNA polymerase involved in DNA repair
MVDVKREPGRVRIAAVHLHQLPFECAFEAHVQGPEDPPCMGAVHQDVRGRGVLIDLSPEARRVGLLPGMTVIEGKARIPDLEVKDRNLDREKKRLESAAEILLGYGSLVEVAPPAFLFVEIGRSARVLEKMLEGAFERTSALESKVADHIVRVLMRAGHRVSVAIAKDPDTARTLAAQLSAEWRKKLLSTGPKDRVRSSRAVLRKRSKKAAKVVRAKKQDRSEDQAPPIEPKIENLVVSAGHELASLARLPVEALLWTDALEDPEGAQREKMHAIHASLRVLGIHDVARLRTLSSAQIASRFGDAGALLMARALGKRERPLRPFAPPDRIIESQELEGPIEDLEPILFTLKRLFDRLEARLEARGAAAGALDLVFDVEPSLDRAIDDEADRPESSRHDVKMRLQLARPTRRAQAMLSLAREKLQNALPGAVRAIAIEVLSPSADRGAQLDLFSAYAKKVEEVSELVGRLQAALGEDAVFSPAVSDTHRPEAAWHMRPFEIERALDALKLETPKRDKKKAPEVKQAPNRGTLHPNEALPEVKGDLLVAEMPQNTAVSIEATLAALNEKKKSWPKPIARTIDDEPLPMLGSRPLELFTEPEPAVLKDPQVLVWRGERIPIVSLSGCERFETEWWTDKPLAREYVIAELADGRKLWLFFEPSGELFVHGAFD